MAGTILFLGAAGLIWGIWIGGFLSRHHPHRKRPGFVGWWPYADYADASELARQLGIKPWFLAWFERFMILAVGCLVLAMILLIFNS